MRLAVLIAAALAVPVLAQPPETPATPSEQPMTIQPVQPQQPAPIPVPEGEVVERKELEGGLIVEDIKVGDGHEVKAGGAVVALYHGTLKEGGTVFDSAFQRGDPVAFMLDGVIEGWQKGVPGMKVGGVRRLTIPAAMAYGPAGRPSIPPNSDLVFVIQLVDVLRFEDIKEGEGEAFTNPGVAVTKHTAKDGEGTAVETVEGDKVYIWIPGEMAGGGSFDAMQVGLDGMKVGGKRRISVPAKMNVAPPQLAIERPQNVPLTFEVELVAVRNLPR